MQREWRDPRDGQVWLVTLNPFGGSPGPGLAGGPGRVTIVFHRPGRPPSWTDYGLSRPLPEIGDQELMDLLDAAEASRSMARVCRFRGGVQSEVS